MATIQFKRGSTATLQNILPAAGEPVWDKELEKLKVGDGVRLYSELPYVGDVSVDDSSIEFDSSNLVSIFGFEDADELSSPVKSEDGKIEWKLLASKEDLEEIEATISDDLAEVVDYIENTLKPQLEDIEEDVDSIKDNIIHIQQEQQDFDNRLDAVEDILEDIHPEDIQEAIEKVETFDGQVDLIEDKLAEHEDRIDALEQGSGQGISPDDIFIIYGGSATDVIIDAHDSQGGN